MNLVLIDNSFFKLSAAQAKKLAIGNVLPKHGNERMADPHAFANVVFGQLSCFGVGNKVHSHFEPFENCTPAKVKTAWVTRTRLTYWEGKPVKNNRTWALHVVWN